MRYDHFRLSALLLPTSSAQELDDLTNLEFQTKDLDKEFLDYHVEEDGYLYFEDFEYEIAPAESEDGLFAVELKKVNKATKKSYHSGRVEFYGKPYETFYRFEANFHDGKLESVNLISKTLGTNQSTDQ